MSNSDFVDASLGSRGPSSSPNASVVLAKAVCRAAIGLGLTPANLFHILETSQDFLDQVRAGETTLDPFSAAGQQALLLVRLYRSLDLLVGHDDDSRRLWMQGHTRGLDGVPERIILRSDGLESVVTYLEGLEAKW